jgi:outer membrane protein assembly factor BamB
MLRRRQDLSLFAVLIAVSLPAPLYAQFDSSNSRISSVYPDISIEAATHLRTAASYVADQNWSEAIDLYQRLIETFGAKVVQVGSSPVYVTVRDYCHLQIAAMPPPARALYRVRADAQAEAWYRAGVRERDRELLGRVVDRAFVSSWGDDAIDALAELAFEAGDFDKAYMLWKRIDPGPRAEPAEPDEAARGPNVSLVYPDPDLDLAHIAAKKVLCLLFQSNSELAPGAMAEFRKRFPDARGTIGGVDGLLIDRLSQIARSTAPPRGPATTDWPTFAGNAQRSKVVPHAVDIGSVQWTTPLPATVPSRPISIRGPLAGNSPDEMLGYHPLVLRDLVLVSGREEVRAYDLHEGPKNADEPLWTFRLRDLLGQASVVATRPAQGTPHYTMTADLGRLYVRMGAPETTLPSRRGGQPDSALVCLDLSADGKEVWRITPSDRPEEADLAFEGSPIVADGSVYIGVTRGGAMTHSYLACFDAATGAKKWRTLICESSSISPLFNFGSISHNLPTLGAGLVFYNTNLGAVAALDQRTGQVRWIATYPRDGREEVPMNARGITFKGELAPCIYHNGLVFAMPSDGRGIHAFDALTGEVRWKTLGQPSFTHMLGVAHGNLICTGSQAVALDVNTGKIAWQWFDAGTTTSYGRGVLAGDYVYFPTKTHIYIIDQRTGVLAKSKEEGALQEKFGRTPGNLAVGEGYLVVAQAKDLTVYCQYDVLINRYRELIAENPKLADPHFRLARAAEDSGDIDLAVEQYRAAIELTSRGDDRQRLLADFDQLHRQNNTARFGPEEERTIRQMAKSRLYSLLLMRSEKESEGQNWAVVEDHYREAATIAPTLQGKLDALLRLADAWRTAGVPEKSLAVYHEVLADDSLRGQGIQVEANRSVRADVEIASRVQSLLDQLGRAVYAPFEAVAERSLAEAQQNGSLPAAERLLRTHPNAQAATHALLYLAQQYGEKRQYSASSAAYRQLLARPQIPPPLAAAALQGIAELHESQRSWHTARTWWQRLAQEFPDTPAPSKPEQSVASFVMDRLNRPPFEQATTPVGQRLQLPLGRRWNRLWSEDRRVTTPEGTPPPELGLVVLASNQSGVECVATSSGEPLWDLKVAGPARWAAHHEDNLLIGTDSQLMCVVASSGEMLWQQKTTSGLPGFAEFQLVDDRVYLREESRKLTCISATTGTTAWNFPPTEGTILPHTFFSSHHVALRTKQPGKFIVLDADGRRRFELQHTSEPWDHVPVALDSHRLAMVSDARTIQLLDLNDGRQVWTYSTLNTDQKPLPIAAPGCLLVLVGGNTLVRLEPETGKPAWSRRVSDGVLPRHGRAWTVDGERFYCITRELNLRAFRLTDGELDWEQFLIGPGDQWQLAAAGGYVVALPRQPHASDGLPVAVCRQSDGSLAQRLFFRPRGNDATVYLATSSTLIGSEREVWALGKDDR